MSTNEHSSDAFRPVVRFLADEGLSIKTRNTSVLPARLGSSDALRISKGSDWSYIITWRDEDLFVDLTASTATFTIANSPGGTALLTLTQASGVTLGDANQNIQLALTDVQTAALSFVRGWAVLTVTTAGVVTRLLEGPADLVG